MQNLRPYSIIFKHTLRQILASRKSIFILVMSLSPILVAIVFRLTKHNTRQVIKFIPNITVTFYLMVITVLISLFYASATIADEIEDQTLSFLLMRPIQKLKLLLSKFLAYLVGSVLFIAPSHLIFTLIIATHPKMPENVLFHLSMSMKYLAVIILGLLAYGSIFVVLSVSFKHPILWGLLIAFGWEKITIAVPGNIKKISVIHHLLSIFLKRNLSNRAQMLLKQTELTTGWIAISILLMITLVFLCLGVQLFQRREYH